MDLTTLKHDVDDNVLVVTLNRPAQLNAFTVAMADELEWTFQHGLDVALDLVYSAEILDAQAAHRMGLVRSVHSADELPAAARTLADRWTKGRSPVAVALTRQMLYRNATLDHPVDAHRVDSLAMFYTSIADGAEGVAAFREKRDPEFTTRASADMPPFYDEWISGP